MNQPVAHIYVRVSDLNGRGGESLYTVDDQEEKARELATQRGYQVGEVVQDLDVSGGKTAADRGLGPLIESCERGEASAVIVWAFDRFSREHPWEVAESLNRLRKSGARLLAVSDGFDSDSEMGVMAASMLSIGAHAYRERMKKSWAMVQKRSLKRGAYPGKTPWGYTRTEEDDDGKPCGPLAVDDSLVEVIRELFQRRAEGAGINGLCDWLVSKGVRSPSGGKGWVHSALSPILASRRYLGEFKFGEQQFHDPDLAIVTEQEWQAAQLPKGKIVPKTGKASEAAMLRGIARCAGCGHTLKILHSNHDRLNYYCKNKSAKGECPARALVPLEKLDSYVEAWFLAMVKDNVRVASAVAAQERAAVTQQAIDDAERDLDAFMDAASAMRDRDRYRAGIEKRERAIELARADHAVALSEARVYGDVPSGDLLASWPDLTVAQKRRLLAAFVDTANVTKGTGPISDRVQFVRDGVVIPQAKEKEGSFRNDRRTTAGH